MMKFKLTSVFALFASLTATAEPFTLNYSASMEANGGPNEFAPYYISALRHGKINSGKGANLDLSIWHPIDLDRRFSYAFGIEGLGRLANDISYQRFDAEKSMWYDRTTTSSNVWLHQMYATVKYRSIFLTAGLKEFESKLLNERLSSGDLSESSNTRPIPGARVGFIDFQNIPLTKDWVQIQGEIGYYKSTDNAWQRDRYNYYNYHITQGWWYNYKNLYFRTKPSENFCFTFGMQACGQFSGICHYYASGKAGKVAGHKLRFQDFVDMLVPREGETYVVGNHLGNWDVQLRYRLRDNSEIKAYLQSPWEDGSGIGKLNGWDGLWGVEWKRAKRGAVSGVVLEFITFMNQSGPLHYDFDDHPGTTMDKRRATGSDNYYNNYLQNGYAIYGMCIGTPMAIQPIRNTNGATTMFRQNRFWGLHSAIEGNIIPSSLSYRAMVNYRRYYGTMSFPSLKVTSSFSAMLEAAWTPLQTPGLKIAAQLACDLGNSIYGDNFGALVFATYSGIFNCKTKKFTPCVD